MNNYDGPPSNMDATANFLPTSYGLQHPGMPPVPGSRVPKVQHFRSVDEFLVTFTACAVSHCQITPSDVPDGRSLGATFRLSQAALAGLPVNLWRPSEWLDFRPCALVAGDRDTAAAHSLYLLQLPTEVLWAATSLDTLFLAIAPASGSPADAKPDPDPDNDASDSDSDDHAQPKADAGIPGAALGPLPDADLLAALRSDTPRVEDLRRHLLDRGLPAVVLKGELVGRLFEHLLAPSAPPPDVRPYGGAPSARSIADSVVLQRHASTLTNHIAGGATAFPRLLTKPCLSRHAKTSSFQVVRLKQVEACEGNCRQIPTG